MSLAVILAGVAGFLLGGLALLGLQAALHFATQGDEE